MKDHLPARGPKLFLAFILLTAAPPIPQAAVIEAVNRHYASKLFPGDVR
jgi:hypothetical protein